jgi:LysM repeat protein
VDRVCPLLGLAAERGVAIDGVDPAHRCHAEDPPIALERTVQAQLCLTASHPRCERYLAFAARVGAASPGRTRLGDGFVRTRLVLAPQPAWRGVTGRARASRAMPWIAAGAFVGTVAVAGAALAAPLLAEPPVTVAATATPTPSSQPTAVVTPSATAAASSASPAPTAVPASPTPTPAPTAAPTVTATTYRVAAGDTLAGIAERFGTTAEAIQGANGIDDPDEIIIGEVLVIP